MSSGSAAQSLEERFDLINEDGSRTGISKPRSAVHRDGDLHRSTHIWVMTHGNPPSLLLQKRASGKDTFPGRWDVSAAGHIAAGDDSLPSAERELEEELGLLVGNGAWLEMAFEVHACNKGSTRKFGRFIDNELQDVYVLRRSSEVALDELKLQEEEVEDARYWTWTEFRDAQRVGDVRFVPRTEEYVDKLEKFLGLQTDKAE